MEKCVDLVIDSPLTSISTLCVCLVGVMQVKVPESSLVAWRMLSRYSSWESLPGSLLHDSGYFLEGKRNEKTPRPETPRCLLSTHL